MAFYLKYRPKDFNSLIGQNFVKETLQKAVIGNKTVGAYLFCGPRGTGKTSTARILAKAINCENLDNGNPCNKCNICESINNESLVDVVEIDAASNTGVDNIRNLIEKAQYPPSKAKYKVYIIDEVHMLSKGAFNALLKILEEPPEYLKFILATTETHKVPETIISRCQRYDFKNISENDLKKRLKYIATQENIKVDEKALDYIVKNSNGGARNAISLFEQLVIDGEIKYENIIENLGITTKDFLEKFLNKLLNKDSSVINDFDDLVNTGKNIKLFFKDLIFFTKEKAIKIIGNDDILKYITILEILDETYSKTKNSLDEKITFTIGILKILNPKVLYNIENISLSNIQKKEKIIKETKNIEFEKQVIDKCPAYGNVDDEIEEEIDLTDIGDIFGTDNNESVELKEKQQDKDFNFPDFEDNFDKNLFLENLRKSGVKGLIIASLKQSEINLVGNTLIIKFKTSFVKKQFDKDENIISVKNILENMGIKECEVELK